MKKGLFLSLKWKLAFALVALSLALVSLYILIAKETFERDKIAYVYSAEEQALEAHVQKLEADFRRLLFNVNTILADFHGSEKNLGPIGKQVFAGEPDLLSFEIVSKAGDRLFLLERTQGLLSAVLSEASPQGKFPVEVRYDRADQFLVFVEPEAKAGQAGLRLRLLVRFHLPSGKEGESFNLLSQGTSLLYPPGLGAAFQDFVREAGPQSARKRTFSSEIGGLRYLVSEAPLWGGNFTLRSFVPEKTVLAALGKMYERSIYFLSLSAFATILISMGLSKGLTRNIEILTEAASEAEAGNLEIQTRIGSRDEVGLLGETFNRMMARIRALLLETEQKSRMEAELITAKAVQDTLFPESSWQGEDGTKLCGYYESASECGGDFWYHWKMDDSLYFMIADATGHGAPAALLTSSIRSVISGIQFHREKDLVKLVQLADETIYATSKGQRLMTAFFARLNLRERSLEFINCSHEPAALFGKDEGLDYIGLKTIARLGDGGKARHQAEHRLEKIYLAPGDTFVLFTDGLSEITNQDGRRIREKNYYRLLEENFRSSKSLEEGLQGVVTKLRDYSGKPLEDDLTMVALRIGTSRI